jgi:hypothetical protein
MERRLMLTGGVFLVIAACIVGIIMGTTLRIGQGCVLAKGPAGGRPGHGGSPAKV